MLLRDTLQPFPILLPRTLTVLLTELLELLDEGFFFWVSGAAVAGATPLGISDKVFKKVDYLVRLDRNWRYSNLMFGG